MFGWLSVRPIAASRRKRSSRSWSSSSADSGRLSAATSVRRRALNTDAMPPRPSISSTWNSPNHSSALLVAYGARVQVARRLRLAGRRRPALPAGAGVGIARTGGAGCRTARNTSAPRKRTTRTANATKSARRPPDAGRAARARPRPRRCRPRAPPPRAPRPRGPRARPAPGGVRAATPLFTRRPFTGSLAPTSSSST